MHKFFTAQLLLETLHAMLKLGVGRKQSGSKSTRNATCSVGIGIEQTRDLAASTSNYASRWVHERCYPKYSSELFMCKGNEETNDSRVPLYFRKRPKLPSRYGSDLVLQRITRICRFFRWKWVNNNPSCGASTASRSASGCGEGRVARRMCPTPP